MQRCSRARASSGQRLSGGSSRWRLGALQRVVGVHVRQCGNGCLTLLASAHRNWLRSHLCHAICRTHASAFPVRSARFVVWELCLCVSRLDHAMTSCRRRQWVIFCLCWPLAPIQGAALWFGQPTILKVWSAITSVVLSDRGLG